MTVVIEPMKGNNMKRKLISLVMIIIVCGLMLSGCSVVSGTGSSTSSTILTTNTSKTIPVFKPASSASSSGVTTKTAWESGNILYTVYYTLREYLASRDNGVVDMSNLYKLLTDVDQVLTGLTSSTMESFTEKTITPPFSG